MMILGIEVKHPPTRELVLLAVYITGIAATGALAHRFGIIPESAVAPAVSAAAAGAILAAFGISVAREGWRALVIVLGLALPLWLGLNLLGLL